MDTQKVCIRKYLSENGKSPLNVSSNAHAQTPRPNHKGVEESHVAAALIPLLLDCGRGASSQSLMVLEPFLSCRMDRNSSYEEHKQIHLWHSNERDN